MKFINSIAKNRILHFSANFWWFFFRISRQIPENSDVCRFFNQISENKSEICRKFWILWKLFTIFQNYSQVSLIAGSIAGCTAGFTLCTAGCTVAPAMAHPLLSPSGWVSSAQPTSATNRALNEVVSDLISSLFRTCSINPVFHKSTRQRPCVKFSIHGHANGLNTAGEHTRKHTSMV